MSESQNNRIFDEFPKIDCNDCSHYWDNSCDGVLKGSQKLCNSFLAVRQQSIPQQIKSLKKALKGLGIAVIVLGIAVLLILLKLLNVI